MEKLHEQLVFCATIFISVLASSLLFASSGFLRIDVLALSSLDAILKTFLTAQFILLAAIFPIPFALLSALSHSKEKLEVYKIGFAGMFPALLISMLLSGFGFHELVLSFFMLAGIPVLLELTYLKKGELKRLVTFRTASGASQKAFLVLSFGLFISLAVVNLEHNDEKVIALGEKVMELAFSDDSDLGNAASDVAAGLLIDSQKKALGQITGAPQFEKLKSKQDPDVQGFVLSMQQTQARLEDPQVREELVREIKEKQQASAPPISFALLREQSPIINAMANYYWLISAFTLAAFFSFFANIIGANIAGAYAALIRKVLESADAA